MEKLVWEATSSLPGDLALDIKLVIIGILSLVKNTLSPWEEP